MLKNGAASAGPSIQTATKPTSGSIRRINSGDAGTEAGAMAEPWAVRSTGARSVRNSSTLAALRAAPRMRAPRMAGRCVRPP